MQTAVGGKARWSPLVALVWLVPMLLLSGGARAGLRNWNSSENLLTLDEVSSITTCASSLLTCVASLVSLRFLLRRTLERSVRHWMIAGYLLGSVLAILIISTEYILYAMAGIAHTGGYNPYNTSRANVSSAVTESVMFAFVGIVLMISVTVLSYIIGLVLAQRRRNNLPSSE